ncbi:MAG: hypothetical protein MJ252_07200 [archaeon]|nr:hypothetical protein [archaeon]
MAYNRKEGFLYPYQLMSLYEDKRDKELKNKNYLSIIRCLSPKQPPKKSKEKKLEINKKSPFKINAKIKTTLIRSKTGLNKKINSNYKNKISSSTEKTVVKKNYTSNINKNIPQSKSPISVKRLNTVNTKIKQILLSPKLNPRKNSIGLIPTDSSSLYTYNLSPNGGSICYDSSGRTNIFKVNTKNNSVAHKSKKISDSNEVSSKRTSNSNGKSYIKSFLSNKPQSKKIKIIGIKRNCSKGKEEPYNIKKIENYKPKLSSNTCRNQIKINTEQSSNINKNKSNVNNLSLKKDKLIVKTNSYYERGIGYNNSPFSNGSPNGNKNRKTSDDEGDNINMDKLISTTEIPKPKLKNIKLNLKGRIEELRKEELNNEIKTIPSKIDTNYKPKEYIPLQKVTERNTLTEFNISNNMDEMPLISNKIGRVNGKEDKSNGLNKNSESNGINNENQISDDTIESRIIENTNDNLSIETKTVPNIINASNSSQINKNPKEVNKQKPKIKETENLHSKILNLNVIKNPKDISKNIKESSHNFNSGFINDGNRKERNNRYSRNYFSNFNTEDNLCNTEDNLKNLINGNINDIILPSGRSHSTHQKGESNNNSSKFLNFELGNMDTVLNSENFSMLSHLISNKNKNVNQSYMAQEKENNYNENKSVEIDLENQSKNIKNLHHGSSFESLNVTGVNNIKTNRTNGSKTSKNNLKFGGINNQGILHKDSSQKIYVDLLQPNQINPSPTVFNLGNNYPNQTAINKNTNGFEISYYNFDTNEFNEKKIEIQKIKNLCCNINMKNTKENFVNSPYNNY